jgi:UDP-N-acetylglucosamine 2-epimerase (non-hydrolysing)
MGPVLAGLRAADPEVRRVLVHTGQHYDQRMSDQFFTDLQLPKPDVHLEVGSGRQGEQTATILARYERFLLDADPRPDATLVVGDVNSTMACALASAKLDIPVVHVEAGLRSFDRTMPEEINRLVTDSISELLLVSEPSGLENLRREGHADSAVRLVGNVMIDVLFERLPAAKQLGIPERLGLQAGHYAVWTMHRPSNVDDPAQLKQWIDALIRIAKRLPVVFPVHPRTKARLELAHLWNVLSTAPGVIVREPLGYLEFLGLTSQCKAAITDSGGLQEETTALGVPCLTLRENTERPMTLSKGTSTLVGGDVDLLERLINDVLNDRYKNAAPSLLWDGKAGRRVGRETITFLTNRRR